MFTLRCMSGFAILSWTFVASTLASPMSFEPTSLSEPYFFPTIQTGNVIPGSAIDLSAGGSVLLEGHNLPLNDVEGQNPIQYPASSPFSLQGLLKSSSGEPDIPITLTGNASASLTLFPGSPGTWSGGFSGTVTSVTFPTGMPEAEIQSLTSILGNLSRFQVGGYVDWREGPSLAAYLTINPMETPVPEPSVLTIITLVASGLAIRRRLDRKKPISVV